LPATFQCSPAISTLISFLQFASEKDDVHFRPTEHDFVVLIHWNNTCHSTWTNTKNTCKFDQT
jgi:hypothetical protein